MAQPIPNPVFPLEIFHRIINAGASDHAFLAICSLVSSAWLPECRSLGMSTLSFPSGNTYWEEEIELVRRLLAAPHSTLASSIQSIVAESHSPEELYAVLNLITPITDNNPWQGTVGISSRRLNKIAPNPVPNDFSFPIPQFRSASFQLDPSVLIDATTTSRFISIPAFNNLTSFELSAVVFSQDSELFSLISSFKLLHSLTLGPEVHFRAFHTLGDHIASVYPVPKTLRRIALDFGEAGFDIDKFLHWLWTGPVPATSFLENLRIVELDTFASTNTVPGVAKFLTTGEQNYETLDLGFASRVGQHSRVGHLEEFAQIIDLGRLPNLRHLRLVQRQSHDHRRQAGDPKTTTWIIDALKSIALSTTVKLRTLVLAFKQENTWRSSGTIAFLDWTQLAEVLSRPQFSDLQKLQLECGRGFNNRHGVFGHRQKWDGVYNDESKKAEAILRYSGIAGGNVVFTSYASLIDEPGWKQEQTSSLDTAAFSFLDISA